MSLALVRSRTISSFPNNKIAVITQHSRSCCFVRHQKTTTTFNLYRSKRPMLEVYHLPNGGRGGRVRAFSNLESTRTTSAVSATRKLRTDLYQHESHDNSESESVSIDGSTSPTSNVVVDAIFNVLAENVFPHFMDSCSEKIVTIVGVSGGCDSVGLLYALHQLNLPNLSIHAVHFDHNQRGSESDGDREFVEQLCRDLQIPLHTYFWDNVSSPEQGFSQDAARTWRRTTMYRLLLQTLTHYGILTTRNLTWREDATNASSKYKRNRVRNELIPLLAEIVGSQELLEKRLDRLSHQSRELGDDLRQRASQYLQENGSNPYFLLPPSSPLSLVHRDAMHLWSRQQGLIISNDQLQRICNQLDMFPRSLQWTLQIGEGWSIARTGASLRLLRDGDIPMLSGAATIRQRIEWSVANDHDASEDERTLDIRLDNELSAEAAFTIAASGEVKNAPFTPSWKSSPIKLKDFLRGRKVPLHLRDDVPVILQGDTLVAVHVNDRWEVDAAFQHGRVGITLSLPTM
ncbi:hypothetical protein MHU86_14345 [Fragilaria crotonensis]|nr:hypothetical protein MHU86_14345 [Fragilaria crotonensis]